MFAVAAITFANGGDNIGVYVPLFASSDFAGSMPHFDDLCWLDCNLVHPWLLHGKPSGSQTNRRSLRSYPGPLCFDRSRHLYPPQHSI